MVFRIHAYTKAYTKARAINEGGILEELRAKTCRPFPRFTFLIPFVATFFSDLQSGPNAVSMTACQKQIPSEMFDPGGGFPGDAGLKPGPPSPCVDAESTV